MAGGKSDYLEKAVLDYLLGGGALPKPATVYVALSTAAYSDAATGSSMSEVSATGSGYVRAAVTNNATNWPNATGTTPATKTNAVAVSYPVATTAWGTVKSFYLCDAATGGNALYGGDLTQERNVGSGDTPSFGPNSLTITED